MKVEISYKRKTGKYTNMSMKQHAPEQPKNKARGK